MSAIHVIENHRLAVQRDLDALRTQAERNKHGQFATPPNLAQDILEVSAQITQRRGPIRFLDPAFGTGSFYSAALHSTLKARIRWAKGFEIDEQYGSQAIRLWRSTPLDLTIADFFAVELPKSNEQKSNLLICNPPYVRHHHISPSRKLHLQQLVTKSLGIRLNGLSGLYCYFMLYAHNWLSDDGVACWLVPAEFLDVRYGSELKSYLTNRVTLKRIHRFDVTDVQFDDALVSSVVVWFQKSKPTEGANVEFTTGGSLKAPKRLIKIPIRELNHTLKWSNISTDGFKNTSNLGEARLSDLFMIKRGIATGANHFFVLTPEEANRHQIPPEFLAPILPSPRHLPENVIYADAQGNPTIDQKLLLVDCDIPEDTVRSHFPKFWDYLESGKASGINHRYICAHRSPWYSQEKRMPAPILCTYMGRSGSGGSRPFRFILNYSKARAANVYLLLYPKEHLSLALKRDESLLQNVWLWLNNIPVESLITSGRSYGGGLHKMEPRELASVPGGDLAKLVHEVLGISQGDLFGDVQNVHQK